MKIKKGFIVRKIGGQNVAVAIGEASKTFNGMIKLNDTGRIIWDMLSEGKSESDIVGRFVSEYDVDEASAQKDVSAFVEALRGADILEQ